MNTWIEGPSPKHPDITNPDWICNWVYRNLAEIAVRDESNTHKHPLRYATNGVVTRESVREDILACFEKAEIKLKQVDEGCYAWDDDYEQIYVWEEGAVLLSTSGDRSRFSISLVSSNHDLIEQVRSTIPSCITNVERDNRGRVYILTQGQSGLTVSSLGYAASDLDLDNYDISIQDQIVSMVSSMQEDFPDGRLFILEGLPGCGKTFLVRSMIKKVKNGIFIFIPPSLVSELGNPSMSSVLINLKENHHDVGPVVLICEDADSILTRRMADNMSAVSSMLNLTSGIVGDVVDIRVLATTNSPRSEMDPALLRSGRLSHHIRVPPLTAEQANKILLRMVPDADPIIDWSATKSRSKSRGFGFSNEEEDTKNGVILADVYRKARDLGWSPSSHKPDEGIKAKPIRTRDLDASKSQAGRGVRLEAVGEGPSLIGKNRYSRWE